MSPGSTVILAEVLEYHIDDRFIDPSNMHVDTVALRLIARMHGSGWYARSTDRFQMQRPRYTDWTAKR